MNTERRGLKRVLGRIEIFALCFGTMVGWGWVVLSAEWIATAGALGAVLAFLLGGAFCIFVGLIYGELISAFPLSGGEVVFSYRALGTIGAWFTGWIISLAYISIASWEGIALSTAVNNLFPLPEWGLIHNALGFDVYLSWSAIGVAGALLLTLLNIRGMRPVAIFQILLLILLFITCLLYALGGLSFGNPGNGTPAFTDAKGVFTVLLVTPSMYIGYDMAAKAAEEINVPLSTVSRVLIASVVTAMLWYVVVILSGAVAAPPEVLLARSVPAADAAALLYQSNLFGKIILVGGICGIVTSWNGFIVGASRILFAMGRARILPAFFGHVHPRYGTPVYAITFVGTICGITPFLGEHWLIRFVDVAALGTVLAYLMVSISYLLIRRREPNLPRQVRLKNGSLIAVSLIVFATLFLICRAPGSLIMPIPAESRDIFFGWMLLGIILLLLRRGFGGKVGKAQREALILGEYAREGRP